jgi:hypothetical protein
MADYEAKAREIANGYAIRDDVDHVVSAHELLTAEISLALEAAHLSGYEKGKEEAAKLEWRKDCFGKERQALYSGIICVGHIQYLHPSERLPDYMRGKWRSWIMTDEEGEHLNRCHFDTADEARAALEDAIRSLPGKG